MILTPKACLTLNLSHATSRAPGLGLSRLIPIPSRAFRRAMIWAWCPEANSDLGRFEALTLPA